MMNLSKCEIIQIEEQTKNVFPMSAMISCSTNNKNIQLLNMLINEYLFKGEYQFQKLFEYKNELFLYFDFEYNRKISPAPDQINDFIEKMGQDITEFKKHKDLPIFKNFDTIKMLKYLSMKPQFINKWFVYGQKKSLNNDNVLMLLDTYNILTKMHDNTKEDPNNIENDDCELLNKIEYFKPQITILFNLITSKSFFQKNKETFNTFLQEILENSEFSSYFINYLFDKFNKLSTKYDVNNLYSIHNLIDLFSYLLTNNENQKDIKDFLKYNLIDLALSPEWRNDFNLLQKTLDIMINFNLELPNGITVLIRLILMKDINKFKSIIDIYHKLNKEQKDELYKFVLYYFEKILFENDVKTIIDCYDKLPMLQEDLIKTLVPFLKKNSKYFKKEKNLDLNEINFLFNSFESLVHHYTIINNDKKELPNEFLIIYNKYEDIFNKIIEKYPDKMAKTKYLLDFPNLIGFNTRLNIFKKQIKGKMKNEKIKFVIDRKNIFESSYRAFNNIKPEELFKKIKIEFIGEKGIDQGGLLRDWYSNVSLDVFNPNFALFSCFGNESYQPNKQSFVNEDHLLFFKFAGKFVARALIEEACINVNFTTSFWKQILQYEPNINDLKEIDSEVYNSFQSLLKDDVDSLCLSFSINEDSFGNYLSIPLKENGEKIDVTNENKEEYVRLYSNYILKGSISDQVNAFCEGFYSLISYSDLRIFTPEELNMLIGGSISIDVNDFKSNTQYEKPYNAHTHIVKLFFDVISKWNNEKLLKLLTFITGSSRLPINGFKGFCEKYGPIIIAPLGDKKNFPVAHTCFNRLDLPEYETEEELNAKLSVAIENCNSFEIV